jgi:hypothetical protein
LKQSRALVAGAALAMLGCREAVPPPKPALPEAILLHVSRLTDLVPAAALAWLVEVHPKAILEDHRLSAAVATIAPEERVRAFAHEWGGVDLREADTLVFASYPKAMLSLAHQVIDPRRIEAAFVSRVVTVEGRASDPRTGITRLWGSIGTDREQLAILGTDCVGLEQGPVGPLRAAALFAEGRLKRASPALHAPPLERVAELLGDAPVRAFAPGPFEGDLQRGAGGLLGASTAVGASVHVMEPRAGNPPNLAIQIVVLGAWGAASSAAAERLQAVFDVLAASGVGRLLGLSQGLAGRTVEATEEALTLRVTVDAAVFALGLHAATAAEAKEIMGTFRRR